MKPDLNWLDLDRIRRFDTEQTDAYRIAHGESGWVERYGEDLLVSFKTENAHPTLIRNLNDWLIQTGEPCRRMFARHVPRDAGAQKLRKR